MKFLLSCFVATALVAQCQAAYPVREKKLVYPSEGCTAIAVDAAASSDGAMTTHTNDCTDCDFRLSLVPARDWPEGSKRPIMAARFGYPRYIGDLRGDNMKPENVDRTYFDWKDTPAIGHIPQVSHTYSYIDGVYGIMNEFQVAIGESTCAARLVASPISAGGKALFDISELGRIALERSKTAKEAILTMGELAEKYGFYGAEWTGDFAMSEAGEAFTVVDPNESWVFHILADVTGASATWVAKRVPKGHITVVANTFTIGAVDFSDKDNYLYSANLITQAMENNFWQPTWGPFDFSAIYGEEALFDIYCSRRMWRIFSLVAPSLNLSPNASVAELPFSVAPERTLNKHDLFTIQRDHYEGTEFDLTKGLAAGPYGTPNRFDRGTAVSGVPPNLVYQGVFERAISLFRTAYSFVASARSDVPHHLATLWFAPSVPHASFYQPVYPFSTSLPESLTTGTLFELDHGCTWWAAQAISNYMDTMFMYISPEVQAAQKKIEEGTDTEYAEAEKKALQLIKDKHDVSAARDVLTDFQNKNSAAASKSWWKLFDHIITKFHDGQRFDNFYVETLEPTSLFYPFEWLKQVGFWKSAPDASVTQWSQTHVPSHRPTPPGAKALADFATTQVSVSGWDVHMSVLGWLLSIAVFAATFLGLGMLLERTLAKRKEDGYLPINSRE